MDYGRLPEESLVARARGGDPAAFAELVVRDRPGAYAQAMALSGNAADAWDVVAATERKAWGAVAGFRGECPYARWRAEILRNAFLDGRRQAARKAAREVSLDASPDGAEAPAPQVADPAPGPEAALEAGEERGRMTREVHEALAQINPVYRVLLILVDMRRPGLPAGRAGGAAKAAAQRRRSRYAVVLRYFRLLSKVPELRRAIPFCEGLDQTAVAKLYEDINGKRNAYDLKLLHAREAFRKAFASCGGRT